MSDKTNGHERLEAGPKKNLSLSCPLSITPKSSEVALALAGGQSHCDKLALPLSLTHVCVCLEWTKWTWLLLSISPSVSKDECLPVGVL